MRRRLDEIENKVTNLNPPSIHVAESELINLPDHLRKTFVTIASKGECDAIQVSNLTGRCRAIESNYLNQLCRMGWLKKRRISKEVHFCPISKVSSNKIFATNIIQEKLNYTKLPLP